jgi:hypothetical protein
MILWSSIAHTLAIHVKCAEAAILISRQKQIHFPQFCVLFTMQDDEQSPDPNKIKCNIS